MLDYEPLTPFSLFIPQIDILSHHLGLNNIHSFSVELTNVLQEGARRFLIAGDLNIEIRIIVHGRLRGEA